VQRKSGESAGVGNEFGGLKVSIESSFILNPEVLAFHLQGLGICILFKGRITSRGLTHRLPSLVLLIPPNCVYNWPLIYMSSIHHIVNNAEGHRRSKKEATPVHGFGNNSRSRWEKAKE
jgi:hypothetical protein